jgi:hypothetical protein
VLFFPQLIAGPIVHYREMMPQFERASCRFDAESFAAGITLFVFGLFKKAVLADGIAVYVTPLFDAAAGGSQLSLLGAWIAALGFTLQIYFDFSGYSDMALGLARLVGVRLPPNFDSPLKSDSIIDFWLRWHMTLTRFLTAYLYNPLVLWLTRRRMAQGKRALGGRGHDRGRIHDPARWSDHPHDARVWRVAWRRLHVRALGALARHLSLDQSRVANVRWPAPRQPRRAYATMASRLCADLPVRRGGDGVVPVFQPSRGQVDPAGHARPPWHRTAAGVA